MSTTITINKKTFWQNLRNSTDINTIAIFSILGMALTSLCSRVSIPLWFTPVPLTLQTFSVITIIGVAGWKIGALSHVLYWGLSMAGLPILAGEESGWLGQNWLTYPVGNFKLATGTTGGYLFGFILAALAVGLFDRINKVSSGTKFGTLLLANFFVYLPGVIWLAHVINKPIFASGAGYATSAFALGIVPFLLGDLIKTVAANSITAVTRKNN
jgi:biotin transport system substrate-specific component